MLYQKKQKLHWQKELKWPEPESVPAKAECSLKNKPKTPDIFMNWLLLNLVFQWINSKKYRLFILKVGKELKPGLVDIFPEKKLKEGSLKCVNSKKEHLPFLLLNLMIWLLLMISEKWVIRCGKYQEGFRLDSNSQQITLKKIYNSHSIPELIISY